LRARVVRRELQDALVYSARFSLFTRAKQGVTKFEIRIDQLHAVARAERELDALLVMLDRIWRQPNQLVDERKRALEVTHALEFCRDLLQLRDSGGSVTGFEQAFRVLSLDLPTRTAVQNFFVWVWRFFFVWLWYRGDGNRRFRNGRGNAWRGWRFDCSNSGCGSRRRCEFRDVDNVGFRCSARRGVRVGRFDVDLELVDLDRRRPD
jgi:hypothetical protein